MVSSISSVSSGIIVRSELKPANPLASVFRPVRDAAVAARSRIQEVTGIESEEQV